MVSPTFYLLILAATVIGALINFLHVEPVRALFYAAASNGIAAPPIVALIVLLASDSASMGKGSVTPAAGRRDGLRRQSRRRLRLDSPSRWFLVAEDVGRFEHGN